MPYIAIKSYPKDEETKKKLVEKINEDLMEICGLPQGAVTISYEEVKPEDWEEQVVKKEIRPNEEKMYILSGEKKY